MKPAVIFICFHFVWFCAHAQPSNTPITYDSVSFFALKREGLEDYLKLFQLTKENGSSELMRYCNLLTKSMAAQKDTLETHLYRNWYENYYSDFDKYVANSATSTEAIVKMFQTAILEKRDKFYHQEFLLTQYLCFRSEYFFPKFWYVGIERYFSKNFVRRFCIMNQEEGINLFRPSSFYYSFDKLNNTLEVKREELKEYLNIGQFGTDDYGYLHNDLIGYAYWYIAPETASYILQNFNLNNNSGTPYFDSEMTFLIKMLEAARDQKIWLVAKFKV